MAGIAFALGTLFGICGTMMLGAHYLRKNEQEAWQRLKDKAAFWR